MGSDYGNSIFWVDVDKVHPNPFQPRREFDEARLRELAESIRQYGILQPLVVTRSETETSGGGLAVMYELIAGERRLRASRIAGLKQVPVIIRAGLETDQIKLELAIIENLQREDINAIDRAVAFDKLASQFGLKHHDIAAKVGKSREYVTNTIRLLGLSEEMQTALIEKRITEGHTRPLLMLLEKPEEQQTLFKEIMERKLTVRESEAFARRVAQGRARKKSVLDSVMIEAERTLMEALGTRVQIEKKEVGGKIVIDFFSDEDLKALLSRVSHAEEEKVSDVVVETPLDVPEQDYDDPSLYDIKSFTV
jgi:ParB family chromosome partitioning protein